jgi:ketosteroid isomerase-like protein
MSEMMQASQAMAFASQFFHGQDRLKGPLPAELCAPTYRAEIVGFPPMDAAAHGEFGRAWYGAFPDITHTIDEARPTDTGVAVRFTANGKHSETFMGIPATNRDVSVSVFVFLTIVDGRVTHLRAMLDQMGLMRQLGVVPT